MSVLNNQQFVTVLVIGAVGAYFLSQKAGSAIEAVNPVNQDNIFNQGANAFGEAITGNPNATGNFFDHLYGALDIANPWAPDYRKEYAAQVCGLK